MLRPATFRAYCWRLWNDHLHKAKPWARDQIGWPLIVLVVTPILAALSLHRSIDWPLFWTSVLFYIVALVIFGAAHFVRAGWLAYQSQDTQIQTLHHRIEGLETEVATKTGECIAAKQEALDAHTKDLKTHKELVKALEELSQAGKTISNSSDAFHQQYAEASRLRGELAKWQNVSVEDADPRIYAEFCDDRGATPNRSSQAYIALINRGGADALNVCIDLISVAGHLIKFPQLAYSISPNRSKFRYPDITTNDNQSADHIHQDVFFLFASEYGYLGDMSIPELVVPLTINYQDASHNLYETKCELRFDPSAHVRVRTGGQDGSIKVIQAKDHKFKKIAKAVM